MLGALTTILALTLDVAGSTAPPPRAEVAPAPNAGCKWSEVWKQLPKPELSKDMRIVPPRRKNGRIERPRSERPREIQGQWVVEAVVGTTGDVRDAAIVERPRVDPSWPEYEAIMLKSVRKFRFAPARANGRPVPVCLVIALTQKWNEWE